MTPKVPVLFNLNVVLDKKVRFLFNTDDFLNKITNFASKQKNS